MVEDGGKWETCTSDKTRQGQSKELLGLEGASDDVTRELARDYYIYIYRPIHMHVNLARSTIRASSGL